MAADNDADLGDVPELPADPDAEVEPAPGNRQTTDPGHPAPATRRKGGGELFLVLVFGFGTAAGLLLAFVGAGFVEQSGALILTVFLSALVVAGLFGGLVFLFRRPILRRLFGVAETQVEMFADPLTRVARGALDRDAAGATQAARDLVALALARYSWLSARRWIITSLTALIAAMAALAGTALLFRQNTLLQTQNDLLTQQNAKVEAQTALLSQDVQLAEAARNAQLAVEITAIAAEMGKAATRAAEEIAKATAVAGAIANPVDTLRTRVDPVTGLDRTLMVRIVSISRALRPYRFLDQGLRAGDDDDRLRVALLGRRGDLPKAYDRLATKYSWLEEDAAVRLIDRPASPERGQLLQVLLTGGLRDLGVLGFLGLDLTFALFRDGEIADFTAQGTPLAYADLTGTFIRESDLGGAILDNARFRDAKIDDTTFATVGADRVRPPYTAAQAPLTTFLRGADFGGAVLQNVDFDGADLIAARFAGAVLAGVSFRDSLLSASDLRGAVVLSADFTGADLRSADFDGAVLFGPDPLQALSAEGERFAAEKYRADPVPTGEIAARPDVVRYLSAADVASVTGGQPAFRLTRVAPFDD